MCGHACKVNWVSPSTGLAVRGVILLCRLHCLLIFNGYHQHQQQLSASATIISISNNYQHQQQLLASATTISISNNYQHQVWPPAQTCQSWRWWVRPAASSAVARWVALGQLERPFWWGENDYDYDYIYYWRWQWPIAGLGKSPRDRKQLLTHSPKKMNDFWNNLKMV